MGTEGDGAPAGAGTRWCGLAGMAGGALLMLFSAALAARQATDWQAGPTLGTPIHLPLMCTITTALVLMSEDSATRFKGQPGVAKRVAWADPIALDEVKAIGKALGCSVNDVLLSSVAGERVRRSNFVYGSAKAGIDGYFQGLGDALHGTGVHVMIVRPGFVHTKMTAGRPRVPLSVGPDAVASAIVRGLERGSEVVWVPPAFRYVMTVLRHVPRWAFRRLPL